LLVVATPIAYGEHLQRMSVKSNAPAEASYDSAQSLGCSLVLRFFITRQMLSS